LLVEIESIWGNKILSGKKCSKIELWQKMNDALKFTGTEEFTAIFCRMFLFEEINFSDNVRVDFIIDLDTHLVFAPKY
jgi:hypothetical protein